MPRKYVLAFLFIVIPALIPGMMRAQDPKTVVTSALAAMGAQNLKTVQFAGMGSIASVGQNRNPRVAWPLSRLKSYTRDIDFSSTNAHLQTVRVQGSADQTQDLYLDSSSGWDAQFDFWLTPYGFLKGALANNASVRTENIDEAKYSVVSYSLQNKYKLVGYINEENMVARVQTWIDNDVLGDMLADASYTVYKDFGGLKFPTMIIQNQGGFPVLILNVTNVKSNPAVDIQRPVASASAAGGTPAAAVQTEKIAEGVYYLKGGTHHSVAVEFADHVAVIEAPQNEARSLAVIAEVQKLMPGKPIRYLINTHHHFDHSGGLRTYVSQGATIVTQQINAEFYEKAFSSARLLNPDRLQQSPKQAIIETVSDKKVLKDATHTLELHLIKDSPHDDGILMAFLPKEKIVIEADVFTPPAANANSANFVDNLEKLRFDFEKIAPLHGSGLVTRADLYAAIKKPVPDMAQILNPPAAPPVQAAGQRGQRGQRGQPAASTSDPAVTLLNSACTGCHNVLRIQNKKADEDEWASTVDRMKQKGAELSDEEARSLVEYLAKTYKN